MKSGNFLRNPALQVLRYVRGGVSAGNANGPGPIYESCCRSAGGLLEAAAPGEAPSGFWQPAKFFSVIGLAVEEPLAVKLGLVLDFLA
jgi:hypothetical protein